MCLGLFSTPKRVSVLLSWNQEIHVCQCYILWIDPLFFFLCSRRSCHTTSPPYSSGWVSYLGCLYQLESSSKSSWAPSPLTDTLPSPNLQHRTLTDSPIIHEFGESPTSDPSRSSLAPMPPDEGDSSWPIALRKGIRSTRNPYPIYNFLSYHILSLPCCSLLFSVSFATIPKNVKEALDQPGWWQAMIAEMQALEHNNTWELMPLPSDNKAAGCWWVYAVKVGSDG